MTFRRAVASAGLQGAALQRDGARLRIGIGRAIAEEVRQHVKALRQPRSVARPTEARDDALLQEIDRGQRGLPRRLDGFGMGRMRLH